MAAIVLDGEAVAAEIKGDLRRRVEVLAEQGVTPGLGTILVGDDGPSANYVSMKHRDCAEIGIGSVHEHLGADRQCSREVLMLAARAIRQGRSQQHCYTLVPQ